MLGIANNGDFERASHWAGISTGTENTAPNLDWVIRYYPESSLQMGGMVSSQLIFLVIARLINDIFHHGIFDLQILGAVQASFFSVAIFFLLFYAKKLNTKLFILLVPFIFFMLIDSSYVSYFNTFYQESSGLIFLFTFLAITLKEVLEAKNSVSTLNFWLYSIVAILLVIAKPQYFILFIPILILHFQIFFNKIPLKYQLIFIISLICISITYGLIGATPLTRKWNVYNSLFAQILGNTSDQNRVSQIFNLDKQSLRYAGIPAYEFGSGINDPEIQKYLTLQTFNHVWEYYLLTPEELIQTSNNLSQLSFTTRINFLGYYEKSEISYPTQQSKDFNIWSQWKENTLSQFYLLLIPFLLTSLLVFFLHWIKSKKRILTIGIFLTLSALSQFFIVLFTEGQFGVPSKHLFLFAIFFDLILYFSLLYWIYFSIQLSLKIKNLLEDKVKKNTSSTYC